MTERTIKCHICGKPYKVYMFYAGDQSTCGECQADGLPESRGCIGYPSPKGFEHVTTAGGGGVFTRCPRAWLAEEAAEEADQMRDAMTYIDKGTMPGAGGWLDQDPRFVDAVELVQSTLNEIEKAARNAG